MKVTLFVFFCWWCYKVTKQKETEKKEKNKTLHS